MHGLDRASQNFVPSGGGVIFGMLLGGALVVERAQDTWYIRISEGTMAAAHSTDFFAADCLPFHGHFLVPRSAADLHDPPPSLAQKPLTLSRGLENAQV